LKVLLLYFALCLIAFLSPKLTNIKIEGVQKGGGV